MPSGRGVTEPSSGRSWRRAAARGDDLADHDPFALLGLPARPGLSDDDVRAAWRRIAAATHPDREDGGDPARFGAAAAAYVMLRTEFGRGEALADLGLGAATAHRGRHAHRRGRPTDPSASGAGRHRARRDTPAGWPTGARLPELRRLRGWIARRGSAHDLPDLPGQGPTAAAVRASSERTARWRAGTWCPRAWPIKRPGGLAMRAGGAAVIGVVAVVIAGWSPGVVGVLAGVLTWLFATARRALGRRRSQ
jgi:hypothetical protein